MRIGAGSSYLFFPCQISEGSSNDLIFILNVIPIVIAIVQATYITWVILVPFILIALGIITLVKAFYFKGRC